MVLRPAVAGVFWGDFSRTEEIVQIGADAATAILPELREKLSAG